MSKRRMAKAEMTAAEVSPSPATLAILFKNASDKNTNGKVPQKFLRTIMRDERYHRKIENIVGAILALSKHIDAPDPVSKIFTVMMDVHLILMERLAKIREGMKKRAGKKDQP